MYDPIGKHFISIYILSMVEIFSSLRFAHCEFLFPIYYISLYTIDVLELYSIYKDIYFPFYAYTRPMDGGIPWVLI